MERSEDYFLLAEVDRKVVASSEVNRVMGYQGHVGAVCAVAKRGLGFWHRRRYHARPSLGGAQKKFESFDSICIVGDKRAIRIREKLPCSMWLDLEEAFQGRQTHRRDNNDQMVGVRTVMSGFKIFNVSFEFSTKGEIEFIDLTDKLQEAVAKSGVKNGLAHVFAPHATGVIILTENEHGLLGDIKTFLEQVIPRSQKYGHASNAHAHLRSILLPPDKTVPIVNGRTELGTWQSLMFVETDIHPRRRIIIIQVIGEQ